MDSGTLGDSDGDLKFWRRPTEKNRIVYTRRTKKKARNSSDNNETATATCSTADVSSSAPSTSAANPSSTVTDASYATATAVVAAEVSTAVISDELNCCGTASPPRPTVSGNLAETSSRDRVGRDYIEQELLEATATKGGDSQQSSYNEEVLQRGSPEKDVDSSGQQMLEKHRQNQEEIPSLSEDRILAQNRVHEECRSKTAGKQTFEELPHSSIHEAENLEKSPGVHIPNEPMQITDDGPPSLKEKSPLLGDNHLLIGSSLAASDLLTANESRNDEDRAIGSLHVPEDHAPAIAPGVSKQLVIFSVDDKIRINLCNGAPKDDVKELRKKLELELDQVRMLAKQVELKDLHLFSYNTQSSNSNLSLNSNYMGPEDASIGGYSQPQRPSLPLPQDSQTEIADKKVLVRMNTEMGIMKYKETRPAGLVRANSDIGATWNLESRPYRRQLSVALIENNDQGIEKEKRTPKANQYYRNSEFLLGKDRLPPENTKRHKSNNGRKHSREAGDTFGFGFDKSRNRLFRSCGSLLQRLMKHKFGWVFNEPVDAKALGLVDYHDIIKHPMDLGTIKTRLAQNWYKSAGQFAEDVRLVFHNAMTYNPKGQDVHIMAEQLLQIFEERWAIIETEYNPYWKYQEYQDGGLRTPPSRKAPPRSPLFSAPVSLSARIPAFIPATVHGPAYVPAAAPRTLGVPASSTMRASGEPMPKGTTMNIDPKIQRPHFSRTPVPKKPKAKDPDKRDMTYDEKQRLSTHLQSLPPEKLDAVIQIIKKRNTAVSQHDDEIEVDIDNVDTETLWELDRFVTNYKKSLSKNKRKAEIALQARMAANQNVELMNSTRPVAEARIGRGAAENGAAHPAEGEKRTDNMSRSSSSNSSSSDSGSSSSDSDSESSSADGSDTERSPRT